MSKARHKARRLATQALYTWQLSGEALTDIELQYREDHDFATVDEAYFQELLHQVPKHVTELDAQFSPLLDRAVTALDPVERAILRLGTYELMFRLDVPYRVVINEGVELAKTFGAEESHKYINGILDAVARKLRAAEVAARPASRPAGKKSPGRNPPANKPSSGT